MSLRIYGGWKHIKTKIFFALMNLPMKGQWRKIFAKWGGVVINGKSIFIGEDVTFDTTRPENIVLNDRIHITRGCILLTHYLDTTRTRIHWLHEGQIIIEDGVFIGANSIITRPLRIGKNSIIAAGSVVTKDIPQNEIWGGNPAKFIKKRIADE